MASVHTFPYLPASIWRKRLRLSLVAQSIPGIHQANSIFQVALVLRGYEVST